MPDIHPERMACDLDPQCNFPYGYFTCNFPEDTVDVEVTVHTLKGNTHLQKRSQYPSIYVQSMG